MDIGCSSGQLSVAERGRSRMIAMSLCSYTLNAAPRA